MSPTKSPTKFSTALMYRRAGWVVAAFVGLFLVGCDGGPSRIYDETSITQASFDQAVGQVDKTVLVKFGATWCPPCKQIDKELPRLAEQVGESLDIVKIDVDENPELARKYNASSIPLMILFRNGEAVSNRVGFMDADEISTWIANTN